MSFLCFTLAVIYCSQVFLLYRLSFHLSSLCVQHVLCKQFGKYRMFSKYQMSSHTIETHAEEKHNKENSLACSRFLSKIRNFPFLSQRETNGYIPMKDYGYPMCVYYHILAIYPGFF